MSIENEIKKLTKAIEDLTLTLNTKQGQEQGQEKELVETAVPAEPAPAPAPVEVVEVEVVEVAAVPAAEPAPAAPVAVAPAAPVETAAPAGSIDDVRAILTPFVQEHGPGVVSSQLSVYGVQTLAQLDPSHYQALIDAVTATVAASGEASNA